MDNKSLNKLKIYLLVSIMINITLISLVSYVTYQSGAFAHIASRLRSKPASPSTITLPHYIDRKSMFEIVKTNNSRVVFLGDSLTSNCEWDELFGDHTIINRGISGDDTIGILNRVDNIIKLNPKKIFIMIGTNDLGYGREVNRIIYNYKIILTKLKNALPDSQIYVQSVLPVNEKLHRSLRKNQDIIALDIKLKLLSNRLRLKYIDIYRPLLKNDQLNLLYTTDGLHLNGEGYLVWKKEISKYINGKPHR